MFETSRTWASLVTNSAEVIDAYNKFDQGIQERSRENLKTLSLGNRSFSCPSRQDEIRLDNITDQDEIDMREQNGNPVKVLSSGYEGSFTPLQGVH